MGKAQTQKDKIRTLAKITFVRMKINDAPPF